MLNGPDELVNLNEKFGNLFCSSGSKIVSKLNPELVDKEMTGLCFWCESRSNLKCRNCQRIFCTFCIKNSSPQIKNELICVVCSCFGISEAINSIEDINEKDLSAMRDRELKDMLHRFEGLCNNDKLAESMAASLAAIDSVTESNLAEWFVKIKSNISSMLQDIEKMEAISLSALRNHQMADVGHVVLPLLRVTTKHHLFRRLVRSSMTTASNDLVGQSIEDDLDDERTQRSPLRLVDEEKSTMKFEIADPDDSEPDEPPPIETDTPTKRRRTRPSVPESERRNTRLRSESALALSAAAGKAGPEKPSDNSVSFNALQSDLSRAVTVFKSMQDPKPSSKRAAKRESPCKTEPVVMDIEWKPKRGAKVPATSNRNSSSSSIGSGSGGDGLHKFSKVVGRHKNSHLVSAAPVQYEKPFLIKQPELPRADADPLQLGDDDIARPPVPSNKTWSWERPQNSLALIKTNGDLPKLIGVPPQLIKHCKRLPSNGMIPISTSVPSTPSSPPGITATPTGVKKRLTPPTTPTETGSGTEATTDSGEPRKKRGRPRKYFSNFSHEFALVSETSPPARLNRSSEFVASLAGETH